MLVIRTSVNVVLHAVTTTTATTDIQALVSIVNFSFVRVRLVCRNVVCKLLNSNDNVYVYPQIHNITSAIFLFNEFIINNFVITV